MERDKIVYIILTGFIISIILIAYISPQIDFSIANPMWNGYSDIENILNATVLNSPSTILTQYPENSSCLILIPYKPYNISELNAIKNFVYDGGTLILLNDYGYGNMILNFINAPVRFNEDGVLIDPLFNYKNGRLPKIMNFNEDVSTRNITSIILNHASIVDILNSRAVVLGESSSFSYFDRDFNYKYDDGEPEGPFPVFVKFRYGNGTVYILSDPSMLLNSMIKLGDNIRLIKNIIGNRDVLIDQYHLKTNIHYEIRQALMKISNFIGETYIFPYFAISLIIIISYLIIRKTSL